MPLTSEAIIDQFRESLTQGRGRHAYLLTGSNRTQLAEISNMLAAMALREEGSEVDPSQHPDFYLVSPQSKARHITVEQVRNLERAIYLKPMRARQKVTIIAEADRLCVGQASAANAFLKTLEEPPPDTLLILWTTQPDTLLPTIVSRCMRLDIWEEGQEKGVEDLSASLQTFLAQWEQAGKENTQPGLRAYARARLLQDHWQATVEELEKAAEAGGEESEDAVEAHRAAVERDVQLSRQETLAALERWYWAGQSKEAATRHAIEALELLARGLAFRVDPTLAVERACLAIEGLIPTERT